MKLVCALALVCLSAFAQKYPGAIATDADLGVAKNNLQVKLLSPVGISDTTIVTNANPSGFTVNMLATIDKEIMFVCAVAGNTLTIGTPGLCPSTSGRGFDGTVAATHNLGPCVTPNNMTGCVSGNVVALHHNAPAKEIEAIEAALGTNLSNVTLALPTVAAKAYDFAAQTPGGTLIAGSTQITMTPVPAGVNGTDLAHPLYVSNGTGTAEACTISGGSGTAGQASGAIILTCANSHTGAWTVQSATNGVQEAVQSLKTLATGGTIQMQPGVKAQCGTVTVDGVDGIVLQGAGKTSTVVHPCSDSEIMFSVPAGHVYPNEISRMSIRDVGFDNVGHSGVIGIKLVQETASTYRDLSFNGTANSMKAFYIDRGYDLKVENVSAFGTVGSFFGSAVDGTGTYSYSNTINAANYTYSGTGASIPVLTLERCVGCSIHNFAATDATLAVTGTGIVVQNDSQGVVLDRVGIEGMFFGIKAQSSTVGTTTTFPSFLTLSNVAVDCAGGSNCTADAFVQIQLTAGAVSIINPILTGPTTAGIGLQIGSNCTDVRVTGGLFDLTQGTNIQIFAPVSGVVIQGNTILAGASPGLGIQFPNAGTITNAVITGNHIPGAGLAISTAAAFASSYIDLNVCGTDASGYCNGGLTGAKAVTDANYVLTETGGNNAIAATLKNPGGANMPLAQGLRVCVSLAHTLQAGANTFSLNGTSKAVKSHFNPANNIATAYASGAQWCGFYDGTQWQDLSE